MPTREPSNEFFVAHEEPDMRLMGIQTVIRDDSAYGNIPEVLDKKVMVTFTQSGRLVETHNLADLPKIFRANRVAELAIHVQINPVGWAHLVCFMHGLGGIVFPSVRFGWLRDRGLALEEFYPKVENSGLIFHVPVLKPSDPEDSVLVKYYWDFESQELTQVQTSKS